jgi:hypothetical protein
MWSAKYNLIIGTRILVFNHGLLAKIQALLCAHFDHLLLDSSPESTLFLLLSTILQQISCPFFCQFFKSINRPNCIMWLHHFSWFLFDVGVKAKAITQ